MDGILEKMKFRRSRGESLDAANHSASTGGPGPGTLQSRRTESAMSTSGLADVVRTISFTTGSGGSDMLQSGRDSTGSATSPFGSPISGRLHTSTDIMSDSTSTMVPFINPFQDTKGLSLVFEPPHPIADIIFIHGLGGTSHRSWAWERDSRNFWPKWLSSEPQLSMARVHTFGYAAGIGTPAKKVSITEFADHLLLDMDLHLKRSKHTSCPIIFVTHSMGGLVAKKAYTCGINKQKYRDMMIDVKAMLFLSTPHKGGNGAKLLDRTLQAFSMSKDYVQELSQNSAFLHDLDRDFTEFSRDLVLFSFYETFKTKLGGGTQIHLVDKFVGVLGLPNETTVAVDADHHSVCKFRSRQDENYIKMRNVLTSLIPCIEEVFEFPENTTRNTSNEITALRDLLSIDETKIFDELNRRRERAKDGTCTWVKDTAWFISWLDSDVEEPHLLWISGEPATGKSFLATYITDYIRDRYGEDNCHFHSFVFSDGAGRSASYLLRSLAYQAARSIPAFRRELLRMAEQSGVPFDSMNASTIWEKIFLGVLFNMELDEPLYWIIDGLDESDAVTVFFKCLKRLETRSCVKILILSRPTNEITTKVNKIQIKHTTHHISKSDTYGDIEAYVNDAIDEIPQGVTSRQRIIDSVLAKASGSFLWVALITKMLGGNWYSDRDIDDILGGLPGEMKPLYARMIQKIEERGPRATGLASTFLTWVTFSFRPLYISELENALQSDFPDLTSVELSIISICGDFVQIEASKVGLIHDTARQFLQSSESSNVITKSPPQSHEYLASICLRYLSSRDMLWRQKLQRLETPEFLEIRRSRGTPLNNPSSAFSEDHPFLVYAAKHWAYHLSLADPDSPQLLALVLKFFRNACLPWINTLAYLNDLNTLIQSAQYIKTYIKHAERAESNGSTSGSQDSDTDELKLWAVDLIKIVGKFGSNLIQNPSSIYRYILPFCPTESITRKTYGSGRGGFAVTGISFREWDSCHARLSVGSDATATTVVATAEIFAALVPQAYSVIVWHAKTCEKLQHIHHGEYVTEVAVNKKGNIVCTAGAETLKIWEVRTGKELGRVQKEGNDRIIALSFGASDEEILVGSQDHLIVRCNWKTGASSAFRAIGPDPLPSQGLRVVSFSPDGTQVAVSSRKRPAELWDMATQSRTHRLTLNNEADHSKGDVFQAAEAIQWHPELGYLFLIYHNMTVVYWNPAYSEQTEHHNIKANMILCSPCGKLLLTSTYEGTVKVYAMPDYSRPQPEFSLLYHLECGESILDVAFSPSGQRFYELRESICSVWDPDELVPPEDVGTEDDPRPLNVVGWGKQLTKRNVSNKARVTAIASAPDNVGFCCGRDDGSLTIHDMEDGKKIRNLPGHSPDATIIALTWSSSGNWIASGDDSGHVVVRKVKMESKSNARTVVFKALDFRIRDGISQLLFSSDDKYLLVATSSTDRIWDVSAKVICQTRQRGSPRPVKWICHPTDKSRLISFDAGDVHIFEWNPFVDSNPERSLLLERIVKDSPGLQSRPDSIETIERIAQTKDSRNIILEVLPSGGQPGGHGHDHSKRRRIELVHAIDFTPDTDGNIVFQEIAPELARESSRLVGSYKNEIVFFNHQNWLCTWEIGSGVEGYKHHLPLPNDWTNKETLNSSVLNDHGTLLCPRNGEVAIIKNGLRL